MRKTDDQVIVERMTGTYALQALGSYRSEEKAGRTVPGGEDRKRQANPPKVCACGAKHYAKGKCRTCYMRDFMRKKYEGQRIERQQQKEQPPNDYRLRYLGEWTPTERTTRDDRPHHR